MSKKKRAESATQSQQQPYDNLLKSLFEGQESIMVPYFLEDGEYLETLTIEVIRTPLRVDRVYKVLYKGQIHILHIEFETSASDTMALRLLDYHSYLFHKYQCTVISIIVYPFNTQVAESPLKEMSGDQEMLSFRFFVFPLWLTKAEEYMQRHAVPMYALLPAMQGANAHLLSKAIDEMIEYYRADNAKLAQELRWMGIMLRRATIVTLEDKQKIEERLNMYDELFEQDPKMQRIRAEMQERGRIQGLKEGLKEGETKGEAKGKVKGEVKGIRDSIVDIVSVRFPSLTESVEKKVARVGKLDVLKMLRTGLLAVPDETSARQLLETLVV